MQWLTYANILKGISGFGASNGYALDMGSIYYLKRIALPSNMCVAINLTWIDISTFATSWKDSYPKTFGTGYSTGVLQMYGVKIGGLFTFNPLPKMYIDGFINMHPTYSLIDVSLDSKRYYNADPLFLDGVSMRYNFGANFRYSLLLVGADFDFGSTQNSGNTTYSSNFKSNFFRLRIGVMFNRG